MPRSSVSTTRTVTTTSSPSVSPKPSNVFYIWYVELCRRLNMQPLSVVKPPKPKSETILDFVADRIKPEEWTPIINALKLDTSLHVISIRSKAQCKFLHDIDSEEKVKHMKRRAGSLFTTYILRNVIKSISNCVKKNCVLSSLELDGVPITVEYLDQLLEALKKNTTVKILAVKSCTLRDLGCQLLCNALRVMPNIEILNLTSAGLGPLSAQYIAKVVRFQQINRYCESWHNSLRYEDPEVSIMAGLKRITLNNNPNITDEGLTYILDELDDDIWIKAIDMQRCGITENIAARLLDVIEYSRSLQIADFRLNDQLTSRSIEKIFEILKTKQSFGYEGELQWCLTTTTLDIHDSYSSTSTKIAGIPTKSKSAPLRKLSKPTLPIRRMKTCDALNNKKTPERYQRKQNLNEAKNSVLNLNEELQREISKRIKSELENKKLKEELEKIKSTCTLVQPKIVKFNPHPIKRKPPPQQKAINKVEFVFENQKAPVHNPQAILQNLVEANVDESDSDEVVEYFRDIIEEDQISKSEKHDESSDSNASLLKFMREVKDGWRKEGKNCYRKVSVR